MDDDRTEHRVVIEQRAGSYATVCDCGWRGEVWDDLRRSEADAWRHEHGRDRLVVVTPTRRRGHDQPGDGVPRVAEPSDLVDAIVRCARQLAAGTAPMSQASKDELWAVAGSRFELEEARARLGALLESTSTDNLGTADEQWLEIMTARHLLDATLKSRPTS